MVLYEDLRIYTIWRTESAQYRQQQLAYKKSAEEWEILGDLAERLHHPEEAVEAWQACLNSRYSPKAMKGVLALYEQTNDTRAALGALIRLIAWQYRWYSEVCQTISPLQYTFSVLTQQNSFHRSYFTLSESSLRKRARSRSEALYRRPVYLNTFWT